MIVQGEKITHKDIELVRKMMDAHPSWNRTHLSRELCVLWNWYATNGQLMEINDRRMSHEIKKLRKSASNYSWSCFWNSKIGCPSRICVMPSFSATLKN